MRQGRKCFVIIEVWIGPTQNALFSKLDGVQDLDNQHSVAPSPEEFAQMKTISTSQQPVWMTISEVSKVCGELIKINILVMKITQTPCKRERANLACSPLCNCNITPLVTDIQTSHINALNFVINKHSITNRAVDIVGRKGGQGAKVL